MYYSFIHMSESRFRGYTESDKAYVQEVFRIFSSTNPAHGRENEVRDPRPDDFLDFHELMCAMRALGFEPTKKDVLSILERCDPHRKRKVTFPQFEKEMGTLFRKRDPAAEIAKAYKLFSADGQVEGEGITYDSLREVARDLGEVIDDDELNAMIDEFDLTGNGRISLDEFSRICEQQR